MAYNKGIITAPVSIKDVQLVLGSTENDLAKLCEKENINKWSVWKPIRHSSPTILNLEKMVKSAYGLKVYTFDGTFADCAKDLIKNMVTAANYPDGVKYEKPVAGKNYHRLTDFINPDDPSKGYDRNASLSNIMVAENTNFSLKSSLADGTVIDFSLPQSTIYLPDDKKLWIDFATKNTLRSWNKTSIDIFTLLDNTFTSGWLRNATRCVLVISGSNYKWFINSIDKSDSFFNEEASANGTEMTFFELYTNAQTLDSSKYIFSFIPTFTGRVTVYISTSVLFNTHLLSTGSNGIHTVNILMVLERAPKTLWGENCAVRIAVYYLTGDLVEFLEVDTNKSQYDSDVEMNISLPQTLKFILQYNHDKDSSTSHYVDYYEENILID